MRIIEVRKVNKGYACYVNTDYDMAVLDNDKRFEILTIYYKNHKLLGKEYYFTFLKLPSCPRVQAALKKLILGPAKKERKQTKPDILDIPSDSFLNRGIIKEHRKRQPSIIKNSFTKKKTKRRKK